MAEEMKGWLVPTPGKLVDTLVFKTDLPRPTSTSLKASDILVRVVSAGINPADYKVPEMGALSRVAFRYPHTPGMDLSGEVVAVGAGVTDVLVGDHVLGRTDPLKAPGSLAEYIILPREGYAKLSRGADLDSAGAAGTAALTAYQTIAPHVKPGDRVFINGGSGGVGTYGIQIAKILGCSVTTSCSTGKVKLCEGLGADHIIDYTKESVVEALKRDGPVYSLAVDNVGKAAMELYGASSGFLLPEGRHVVVAAGSPAQMASLGVALVRPSFLGGGRNKLSSYLTYANHEHMVQLADWFSNGKLKTVVDSTYEFTDVPAAFEHLSKGSSAGKIVIHVSGRA